MIDLVIHLETVNSHRVMWWADSPQVPGFSAAADSLSALRARAKEALAEVLGANVAWNECVAMENTTDDQNPRVAVESVLVGA